MTTWSGLSSRLSHSLGEIRVCLEGWDCGFKKMPSLGVIPTDPLERGKSRECGL